MLPGCRYHESCRRVFFRNGYRALLNVKTSNESNQTSCQHADGTVLFGNYYLFCKGNKVK